MNFTYEMIASKIDHALLLPTMTDSEMIAGCELARLYEVATVCVKPAAVASAVRILEGSRVGVGTVIGFPHGGQTTVNKVAESIEALATGASEIDMVVNIGAVMGSNWELVRTEIAEICRATHDRNGLIKVIFETCYLNDIQKIELCRICSDVGVDYVKTSTGFGTNGATLEDIKLMRANSSSAVKVKASGRIKDLKTAKEFVECGSDRLGTSRTSAMLDELLVQLSLPPRDVSRETKPTRDDRY